MGPVDVAIVGGGASGTLVAVQLLRQARGPWRIALVERSGALARGLAYGPAESCHLLNVPAAGMSALPDDEGHFARWSGAAPDAFVPRALYGAYLEALLTEAHARAAPGVALQLVCGDAVSAAVESGTARIGLRDGREIQARAAVLALGNLPSADPPVPDGGLYASGLYRRSPWESGALDGVPPDSEVMLVGSGLTMVDAALALQRRERCARLAPRAARSDVPRGRLAPGVRRAPAGHAAHLGAAVGGGAAPVLAPPARPLGRPSAPHGSRGRGDRRAAAQRRPADRPCWPGAGVRGGGPVCPRALPPARRWAAARSARGAGGELHRPGVVAGRREPPAARVAVREGPRLGRRAGDGLRHRPRRRAVGKRRRPALHPRRPEARRAVGIHRHPRAALPGPGRRHPPGRLPLPPLRRRSSPVATKAERGSAGARVRSMVRGR